MNPRKVDQIIKISAALSLIVSFVVIVFAIVFIEIPENNKTLFDHTVGIVEAGLVGSILAYFFTSAAKDHPNPPTEP